VGTYKNDDKAERALFATTLCLPEIYFSLHVVSGSVVLCMADRIWLICGVCILKKNPSSLSEMRPVCAGCAVLE
jgi:hypothetical protein